MAECVLKGKVAMITGASSGIGKAIALRLAAEGATVALVARREQLLQELATQIAALGAPAMALPGDVTVEADVERAVDSVIKAHGRLDILVNNAGVGFPTNIESTDLVAWRRIVDTNMTGVFLCTRAALPHLAAVHGHIVNVSSSAGKRANPTAPIYCASKFGLNGFTDGLAQQVRQQGIRVSTVSPSAVDTDYWAGRTVDRTKMLRPEQVAEAVAFILTRPSSMVISDLALEAFPQD